MLFLFWIKIFLSLGNFFSYKGLVKFIIDQPNTNNAQKQAQPTTYIEAQVSVSLCLNPCLVQAHTKAQAKDQALLLSNGLESESTRLIPKSSSLRSSPDPISKEKKKLGT